MHSRKYSSYAEIDRELEILQLERQIHVEKIKLELGKTKENLKLGNLVEGYFEFSKEEKASFIFRMVRLALPTVLGFFKGKNK